MDPHQILDLLQGNWRGTCRTWFEPEQLADESEVHGSIAQLLNGQFVRHTYHGAIQGKPRHGEETIAWNSAAQVWQCAWFDSFHMNYSLMFSVGPSTSRGFQVCGEYDVGENQPRWGWKTVFEPKDANHFTITAYNISPSGEAAKAVETTYTRATK